MVIALFALAFAMIVGGLLATILGWDIVLLERGWTMVIAGSISAASGALLLGVAAIVSRLTRIQSELMRLQANLVEDEEALAASSAAGAAAGVSLAALAGGLFDRSSAEAAPAEAPRPEEPTLPLFGEAPKGAAAERSEAVRPQPETETPAHGREAPAAPEESGLERFIGARPYREPSNDMFRQPPREGEPQTQDREVQDRAAAASTHDEASAEPEGRIPDFLVSERYHETFYAEIRSVEAEPAEAEAAPEERNEDLFAPEPGPRAEPEREPEPEPESEPEPEAAAAEDAPEREQAGAPTVIGSYNSGDNRYVMYSDGSIEAETPQGTFRFQSLDELKQFIATGEGGTRIT
ncbi:hypothetical protein [Microvirga thermotolerans]|uniref:DUF308 domain-containing protein n=1 Tax=Microvirga thermotolerans TaxID=2651334 RepID=A0A5P9K475_9HYPH|nr:hypothetical protein [Microvirga thermotolerans]QFU17114.1 hypothetical protein GDR74_13285 [Microvirga thermotolerans]